MANEVETLIGIYQQVEDAGLMVTAGKKDAAELMVSHDVIPVVRCGKCERYDPIHIRPFLGTCSVWDTVVKESGFCHHGERRTDDTSKSDHFADR